jgi:hypothetical protein
MEMLAFSSSEGSTLLSAICRGSSGKRGMMPASVSPAHPFQSDPHTSIVRAFYTNINYRISRKADRSCNSKEQTAQFQARSLTVGEESRKADSARLPYVCLTVDMLKEGLYPRAVHEARLAPVNIFVSLILLAPTTTTSEVDLARKASPVCPKALIRRIKGERGDNSCIVRQEPCETVAARLVGMRFPLDVLNERLFPRRVDATEESNTQGPVT